MEINCDGCGLCCYSEIRKTKELIIDDKEQRENVVRLTHDEIKKFFLEGFGGYLFIEMVLWKEDENLTLIKIAIKNFRKIIDGKWWMACPFFDPPTKKCRIYKTELYPLVCKSYPYLGLLEDKLPYCKDKITGKMDKTEMDKANEHLKILESKTLVALTENIDVLKQRITKAEDARLLCRQIFYKLFGEPKKEIKLGYKELMEMIHREHQKYGLLYAQETKEKK